jgi:hypothetical protein
MKVFFSSPHSHPRPECKVRTPALSGVPSLIPKINGTREGTPLNPVVLYLRWFYPMHVPKTQSRYFDAFHQGHTKSRRHIERYPMIGMDPILCSPCVGWLSDCVGRLASKQRLQTPELLQPRLISGPIPVCLCGIPALAPVAIGA